MKRRGWNLAATTMAAATGMSALVGASGVAGADDAADPAVVAGREAAAAAPVPAGYQNPPSVEPSGPDGPDQPGELAGPIMMMKDLYTIHAVQRSGGYIEASLRDNPIQDKPGPLSTTMRIYGNAAAFRDGPGDLGLTSKFTCTGAGISGVTIGSGGVSVTGGPSSTTLTWSSLRNKTAVLRQYYTEGGHFRCKASNVSPAKFTRRITASTNYKDTDTRAEGSYNFVW
ncbi:MAG: hypothetical protein JWO77_1886 [Ilumatobacteraceae bacterium]|nr:hypothetical protein [Ilumatobacteraceae bacterium]